MDLPWGTLVGPFQDHFWKDLRTKKVSYIVQIIVGRVLSPPTAEFLDLDLESIQRLGVLFADFQANRVFLEARNLVHRRQRDDFQVHLVLEKAA